MNKCGYFQIADPFYDESGYDCESETTHTSCNYGDVCEEHTCRCSRKLEEVMKKEVTREINKIYGVESDELLELTDKNLPLEKIEVDPKEFSFEFGGENGIRITNDGEYLYGTIIEIKNIDGEWEPLSAVQSISIEISVDNPTPKVKIERYILSGNKQSPRKEDK
jgi:hypothetical protein